MALTADNLSQMAATAGEAVAAEAKDWDTMSSTAYEELGNVKRSDLTELKSLKAPPVMVKKIMAATLIALGHADKDLGWQNGQRILTNPAMMQQTFKNFDPKSIDRHMLSRLKPYMDDEDCTPQSAARGSKACFSLALWVHAVYDYGSQ